MGIKTFVRSKLKNWLNEDDNRRFMAKAKMVEGRWDSTDPLIADSYAPQDLVTFLSLYSSHPWVHVCAQAISTAAASVPFEIRKGGKTVEAEEHAPFLKMPNPYMTWFDLIETTFLYLELGGNCYWEIVKKDNEIIALYPLRPDRMRILPDPRNKIAGYEFNPGNGDHITFKPEEILHLKYTDARNEFYGVPPVSAVKNEITLDFNATNWNKNFFVGGAEPGGVLQTDKSLTQQAYARLREQWYKRHRGIDNAHEIAILEEGLKYQQITSKHADMQYHEMKAWNRDTILAVMRVPPVIIGLTMKLSTGTERDQKKIFWHDNVIPKLTRLQHAINAFLMDDGLEFLFIIKAIDSIVEDDQVKSTIVQSNISWGIMTQNEAREKYYGMKPVPWGDTWWRPVGLVDVKNPVPVVSDRGTDPAGSTVTSSDDAGSKSPTQVKDVNQDPKEQPKKQPKKKTWEVIELEKTGTEKPNWTDPRSMNDYREWTFLKTEAGPDDRKLRHVMEEFFQKQGKRLIGELERHESIRKADGVDSYLFDLNEENDHLETVYAPLAAAVFDKYASLLMAQLSPGLNFNLQNQVALDFLKSHAADLVTQINETTRELLKQQLIEGFAANEDMKQIIARISKVFDGDVSLWRAAKIARTELLTLVNNGRFQAAVQSGTAKTKRWVSAELPTTRQETGGANHVHMHNQVKPLMEPFEAPNRAGSFDKMMTPGDTGARAENRVNCLCYCSFMHGNDEFRVDLTKEDPKQEPKEEKPTINVTVNLPPATVNNNVNMPEQKAPVVNLNVEKQDMPDVIVNVPKQDAPTVNVTVEKEEIIVNVPKADPTVVNVQVEKQDQPQVVVNLPAPEVTINNNTEVKPADVVVQSIPAPEVNIEVKPEVKLPATRETIEVFRDNQNRITSATKTVEPK